ncbi:MAG: GNAT family protein [Bacteroidota bacterium]
MYFDFSQSYVLEDEFVRLTPLLAEDKQALKLLSEDADIWTYFLEKGKGGEDFDEYIQHAFEEKEKGKEYPYVIYDKVKRTLAGMTRFYEYSSELKTIKLGHSWYGKAFRGTGINKHCKYLLFEFAFDELGLERIGFGAYATNTVSLAAMRSVGCKQEGVLRNLFPALDGNGRTDCALFSILKEEWLREGKVNLQHKLRTP